MLSDRRLAPGDRVGRFEVTRFLSRGGMGAVYAARDTESDAAVALKVLLDTPGADAIRFERECRIAARLDHPHIVKGLGHGHTEDGLAWLAMELLRGEDLEAALARRSLALPEVIAVLDQVCDALEYSHGRGVIHRDLKPSNIFLCEGPAPRVKVLDFGIARLTGHDTRFTRTGATLGTLAYMSPEQARGEPDLDARTDVWSLGVVAYECLAGRRPFVSASPLGLLYQIIESDVPELGAARPELPSALVEAVHGALRKKREERHPSPRAMRALFADDPGRASVVLPSRPSTALAPTERDRSRAPTGEDSELRLVTAVALRDVRDPVFVRGVAVELGGRFETLVTGGHLCLFGVERWSGDEPLRALRFATAVAPAARGSGVVTDRVLRSAAHIAGAALDAASALAERDGVSLDANTASFVRGEFTLTRESDGTARCHPTGPDATASLAPEAPSTPLVGRDTELGALLDAVTAAASEQRVRGVLVLGGAGLGKSSLRREAAVRLAAREPSATFLVARCDLYRSAAPFAALRDALTRAVDASAVDALTPATADADPQAQLDRARTTFETLLAGLAERGPVVLAFDDAQWLDASSRSIVRWISDNTAYLPLAVWLFARPEGRDALREVVPDAAAFELPLLARPHAERLLSAVAGAAPEALIERAGGHPLVLEELGRMYARGGEASLGALCALPLSVEAAHLAQLDQLDQLDREFLKRAAVFGRHGWVEGVVALGGTTDAATRLARSGLLALRPRSRVGGARDLAFRVGSLQDAAYGLLPEPQRAQLHGLAARWLCGRADVSVDELARHWDLAGDRTRAAEAYTAAAEAAARVADLAAVRAHADRVRVLSDDPRVRWRVLVARDEALQLGGDLTLRREGLAELAALAEALGLRHRVEACWRRCYFARASGDREVALATAERALGLARELGEPRWSAAVHIELAMLYARESRHEEALACAVIAAEDAATLEDPWQRARAAAARAYVAVEAGDLAGGLDLYEVAVDGFGRAGDRRREAAMRANAGFVLMELGRTEEAERQIRDSIEAAQRVGSLATVATSTHNLGAVRRARGDYDEARALLERASEISARAGLAKVAAEVATEGFYLDLARGASTDELAARAREIARLAEKARTPALLTSAFAAALRAGARGDRVEPQVVAEARARLSQGQGRERVELLVALYEAEGARADGAAAVREAVEEVVAKLEPDDRGAARAMLCRRYLIPETVGADGVTGVTA